MEIERYILLSSLLEAIIGITDAKTIIVCENTNLLIDCDNGNNIYVCEANYGRTQPGSYDNCDPATVDRDSNQNCKQPSSLQIVRNKCQGRPSCSFSVENALFNPDPCNGVYKYLEVNYTCTRSETPTSCSNSIITTEAVFSTTFQETTEYTIMRTTLEQATEDTTTSTTLQQTTEDTTTSTTPQQTTEDTTTSTTLQQTTEDTTTSTTLQQTTEDTTTSTTLQQTTEDTTTSTAFQKSTDATTSTKPEQTTEDMTPITTLQQITEDAKTSPAQDNETSTVSIPGQQPECHCVCTIQNITLEEKLDNIRKELFINKSSLSSTKRKLTSADDKRASAMYLGMIGASFLTIFVLMCISGDVLSVLTCIYENTFVKICNITYRKMKSK